MKRFFGAGDPEIRAPHLKSPDKLRRRFQSWGMANDGAKSPKVVFYGGMGYGNVGDEAQMGASISRWQKLLPDAELSVFSPNPDYSEFQFHVPATWAPRVAWFHSNTNSTYFRSGPLFTIWYWTVWARLTVTARAMRSGLPLMLCSSSEYEVLRCLQRADGLHVSGGGYLTGMTRSRLWECALVMRLCQLLGTPYFLTGQTIGVFRGVMDRWIAKKAFGSASIIYLRDQGISEEELKGIGVSGSHIKSSFDDALFFESLDDEATAALLKRAGINADKPYVIANFHYWGQNNRTSEKATQRFAELADLMAAQGFQVLFVPMTPSDEAAEDAVIQCMDSPAVRMDYNYDYREARAVYREASAVFTMKHHPIIFGYGEGVPVISVALDDYYYHKNKGAMDNCGHGDFCLEKERFFSKDAEKVVKGFFENLPDYQNEISNWVDSARLQETEAIDRFIRQHLTPLLKGTKEPADD